MRADIPAYSPELARELRAAAGLTESAMCAALGLSQRGKWRPAEEGREPSRQTWLLALIVGGRHPDYVRRTPEDQGGVTAS